MNELSAALRQFADRLEARELLAGANQCAIVLANSSDEVQAVYMGAARVPADKAGTMLLAAGIIRFQTADNSRSDLPAASPQEVAAVGKEAVAIFEDHK